MSLETFTPTVVDELGGLNTLIDRGDLPAGTSPAALNVDFYPGGVKTRPGLEEVAPNAGVTGGAVRTVTACVGRNNEDFALLMHDDGSRLVRHDYVGGYANIKQGISAPATPARMIVAQQDGRQFMAFNDGRDAICAGMQYDSQLGLVMPIAPPSPDTNLTITEGAPVAPSTGVAAGVRTIVCVYETLTGHWTGMPYLWNKKTCAGGKTLIVSDLPIGPAWVAKRILFVTAADDVGDVYTLPAFEVPDNTTTSITLDFTESELIAGTSGKYLFTLKGSSPWDSIYQFESRLIYWRNVARVEPFAYFGEDYLSNPVQVGLRNLDFNGLAPGATSPWWFLGGLPNPTWVYGVQGSSGICYKVTGTNTGPSGSISQWQPNVFNGRYYLQPGKKYGIKARFRSDADLPGCTLLVALVMRTAVGGTYQTIATLNADLGTALSDGWVVGTVDGTVAVSITQQVGTTIQVNGLMLAGVSVWVDYVEFFEVGARQRGTLYFSTSGFPEEIDLRYGEVAVGPLDGTGIASLFDLRGTLYAVKDGSVWAISPLDAEPNNWSISKVADDVGSRSPCAAAMGEGWVVIAGRSGCYLFSGGLPDRISTELQPTWDEMDWENVEKWLYVATDTTKKKVIIGGIGRTTDTVGIELVIDYKEGMERRKWAEWHMDSSCADMLRLGSAYQICYGLGRLSTLHGLFRHGEFGVQTDDYQGPVTHRAIEAYYETAPVGAEMARSLYGALTMKLSGVGVIQTRYVRPGDSWEYLPTRVLKDGSNHDVEILMNKVDTQPAFRISSLGAYWSLRRMATWSKRAPAAPTRGHNL